MQAHVTLEPPFFQLSYVLSDAGRNSEKIARDRENEMWALSNCNKGGNS